MEQGIALRDAYSGVLMCDVRLGAGGRGRGGRGGRGAAGGPADDDRRGRLGRLGLLRRLGSGREPRVRLVEGPLDELELLLRQELDGGRLADELVGVAHRRLLAEGRLDGGLVELPVGEPQYVAEVHPLLAVRGQHMDRLELRPDAGRFHHVLERRARGTEFRRRRRMGDELVGELFAHDAVLAAGLRLGVLVGDGRLRVAVDALHLRRPRTGGHHVHARFRVTRGQPILVGLEDHRAAGLHGRRELGQGQHRRGRGRRDAVEAAASELEDLDAARVALARQRIEDEAGIDRDLPVLRLDGGQALLREALARSAEHEVVDLNHENGDVRITFLHGDSLLGFEKPLWGGGDALTGRLKMPVSRRMRPNYCRFQGTNDVGRIARLEIFVNIC